MNDNKWNHFSNNTKSAVQVTSNSMKTRYECKKILCTSKKMNRQRQIQTCSNYGKCVIKPELQINKDICNNCGKYGHLFRHCKNPIVSFGCVQFRLNNNVREYLMICRKDTLGYIDFIRGKYILQDDQYIINMFKQMTDLEKKNIFEQDFKTLWDNLWKNTQSTTSMYKAEEETSCLKFNKLKKGRLQFIIDSSNKTDRWKYPEWGFPKGRRNYLEGEYECAVRETVEETGVDSGLMIVIKNVLPFEEVFIGSNYKNYKHKYYLMFMKYDKMMNMNDYDDAEVSLMEWKTYDDCINSIRTYNHEKINMITRIDNTLEKYWKV
jgi:ADP-ribose pyrophosphatase YjhB (NUDIX family)